MKAITGREAFIGIGVSEGVRIGKAFVYKPLKLSDVEPGKAEHPAEELTRLEKAKASCTEELIGVIEQTKASLGEEKAAILKGQVSFLNDPAFYPPMQKLVETEGWTAETAVQKTVQQVAAIFEGMPSEYMRERAADVRDVGTRLLVHLMGQDGARLSDIREEVILVADDLTPSDTVQLNKNLVLGFVTRIGGKTSHTAILANSLGIAAVLGVGEALDSIPHGVSLLIDGTTGICMVEPDEAARATYTAKQQEEQAERERLKAFSSRPAVSKDGFKIEIAANIGAPEEAEGLVERGAEAVGLYRTEFLFMSETKMPGEDVQMKAYAQALKAMEGRPVIIRTLDIGGDKELPYLELPHEMNPFLGYRAIRLCLDRKELLHTQLRAILRASVHGSVKIMFPMISGIPEWRAAKAMFEEAKAELLAEGKPIGKKVEVGIMVEIPSAALLADRLAREADFFSIGTNDLVQYTVAVDRMNEKVSYLYDYFHPSVLRLIREVIEASVRHGKWSGMCGSMAGDPLAAPLLLGMGLKEWSMSPSSIQRVKETVSTLDREACVKLTDEVMQLDTPEEIRERLKLFLQEAR
ncbi:phosphoenolpyruvate--protein phosphotransferase [Gorillibacterium sp. CAU 1737]|uniref:phosphoenolpyruvate--protein phosphotransferase n=1 Tax=Gorillibacterium sp. CAU 1737 TaxID=3140362 RepID=UPI00326011E3